MIKSQFNYCPFVWMFCLRQSNNLINKVHERDLRLTYRDENKNFQQIQSKIEKKMRSQFTKKI